MRAAARARFERLALPACQVLADLMDPEIPHAVRLRAARTILRINGLTAASGTLTPGTRKAQQRERQAALPAAPAEADGPDAEIGALMTRLRAQTAE